jgi:shikimate dehydrogenase
LINKEKPEVCISISSSPGTFGETVHNSSYKFHNINFLYKAIKTKDLRSTVNSIRELNVKGCSVSMPFKERIIKYLNKIDPLAKQVGAVNTVLNSNKKLTGFNTDVFGASKALSYLKLKSTDSVLILGAGGVSRAIIVALKNMKVRKLTISNRNSRKSIKLGKLFKCNVENWNNRHDIKSDVLINATSIGMLNNKAAPININSVRNFNKIMDVIVSHKDTAIIKEAKKLNILNVSGIVMTFYQAAEQYKIYTGLEAPIKIMLSAYNKKNSSKIVI